MKAVCVFTRLSSTSSLMNCKFRRKVSDKSDKSSCIRQSFTVICYLFSPFTFVTLEADETYLYPVIFAS